MAATRSARCSRASRILSRSSPWGASRKTRWAAGTGSNAVPASVIRRKAAKAASARSSGASSPLVYSRLMFDAIETPALLLDADKLERNCKRMRSRIHAAGVVLRPHMKTAKSVEVAQRALDAPSGPITVSTLREAEYFFDHGFRDILYAVGMVPAKVARIADLVRRGAKLTTIVDSVDAALGLVDACANAGVDLPALIEIDSDGHRAGIAPGDERLLAVAATLGPKLRGVMTHAGDS